jgi:two-component system, cell cycle response regulator
MRARLIKANTMMRLGKMAGAGLLIRRIHAWAVGQSHAAVLARSHRLLNAFFFRLGDVSGSLENALYSLEYLPEDTMPQIRGKHLMGLALALDMNGEHEEAHRRFQEILDINIETGHVQQLMNTLNNMAFSRYKQGEVEEASKLMAQIRAMADKFGIPLSGHQLDTVSRIELLLGRPETAERTLQPILDEHHSGGTVSDLYALPDCLLTVAEAQRLQGAYARAQATLDEARQLSEKHGLKGFVVGIRLEQARLFAAAERYKEAYEEHCRYHSEAEALRSDEREARARILQAVFETEEARRSSETYRELAHRDPLTGLYNRRFIDAFIDGQMEKEAGDQELTAVLIDLDHFKKINDNLSHKAGDAVLVQIAKILTAAAVEPAKAARLGGEEFVIFCPGYNAEKGMEFAQRLSEVICHTDWSPIAGNYAITASIGVCTAAAGSTTRTALLSEADRNLYLAKNAGRNRVVGSRLS